MFENSIQAARAAQHAWADRPVKERVAVLRRARRLIAGDAWRFAQSVALPGRRADVETLPMEVLPLLEAIRFVERNAGSLLKPRRLGRAGRPLWLTGVEAEIRRDPHGLVLVIAPFNYPLFLPGVQVIQALAAGNAVLVKPSPGHAGPMRLLAEVLADAGLPDALLQVLPDDATAAQQAIETGVDLIVLTGSAATGRAVLAQAAGHLAPAIVELSGSDPVFVLPGADVARVAETLAYGLRLNGGATCIAPRCAYLPANMLAAVEAQLVKRLSGADYPVGQATARRLEALSAAATIAGGRVQGGVFTPDGQSVTPMLIIAPSLGAVPKAEDIFAPFLVLVAIDHIEQALVHAAQSPYGLGATVLGPAEAARAVAARIDTGTVVVNDMIAPTADPRVPFEGRRNSGFGPTRGAEGLVAMTKLKTILVRRRPTNRHMIQVIDRQRTLFLAYIRLAHGGIFVGNRGRR